MSISLEAWNVEPPSLQSEEPVSCHSLPELLSQLSSRTKIPIHRLEEFVKWSDQELQLEIEHIRTLLKQFSWALVCALDEDGINKFLASLDLKTLSSEYSWHAVASLLHEHDSAPEEHKQLVVFRYMQYLGVLRRLLEFTSSGRASHGDKEPTVQANNRRAPLATLRQAEPDRGLAREALDKEHVRLPLGEPVEIPLPARQELKVILAGHIFRLAGHIPPSLVDQHGVTYFLKRGKNIVGRHSQSDVVVNPDFRDVSRAHLVLDWRANNVIRITDLSLRGTYVDAQCITSMYV